MKTMDAWWFSAAKTLPHGDGRRIKLGQTHKIKGEIIPCENGLHASVKPLDALSYSPGPIIWRVRLSGIVVPHGGDKHCASERTYLAGGIDVSDTLRKFGRLCALDVIALWDAPDIVKRYLKTGDESIRAAARAAAWDAAGDAAWDAARAAAWDAAWATARATARAAARAAAGDACIEKQNRRLGRMLRAAIKEGA